MLKQYSLLLLLLILFSCKDEKTETNSSTYRHKIRISLEVKKPTDAITNEMLKQSCVVLSKRLSALTYDRHKVHIVTDSQIEIELSRPLNPTFKTALFTTESVNIHRIESEHLSKEYADCFKALDSILESHFEQTDSLDDVQREKVLFRHLWADGYSAVFPEEKRRQIENLLTKEEIRQQLGSTQLLWNLIPLTDTHGNLRKDNNGSALSILHHLSKTPSIRDSQIDSTTWDESQPGQFRVLMQLKPTGVEAFHRLAQSHRGKLVALLLGDKVHTVIKIVEKLPAEATERKISTYPEIEDIDNGGVTISHNLDKEQALALAVLLDSKPLPFRFLVID